MFRLFFATVLVVASFGQTALATEDPIFPMLYHVDGVAEGGVLNIRAEPAMKAEVIGTLDAAARNVEVIEAQGGWGRINVHERTGWVAMRFLSAPSNPWRDNGTPKLLRCFGTEPFWHATVDLSKQQLRLVNLAEGEVVKTQDIKHVVAGRYRTPTRAILSDDITLMVTPVQCSDGMSDYLYGLAANLITDQSPGGPRPRILNGCCSVTNTLPHE